MSKHINKKWTKGEMSRTIVMICLRVMMIVLAWSIVLKTLGAIFGWMIDISDVLNFTAIAFGGELLILAFKRIFAKDREETE